MPVIDGTESPELLTGTAGADTINGLGGNDTLDGGDGDDVLNGGDGDDYLFGQSGHDQLNGGAGNDYIVIEPGETVDGGPGIDRAIFSFYAANALNVDFSPLWAGGSVTLDGASVTGIERIDSFNGSDFADLIVMGTGYTEDNLFQGSPGIYGRGGDDTITGGGGKDQLSGDDGNDRLFGLGNDDILYGGAGNDHIEGGDGNDQIYAGADADYAEGGAGFDSMYGREGNDELHGGDDGDTIDGEDGDDLIYGEAGNDYLIGGSGFDHVYGGEGDDGVLFTDDDVVDGGAGANQLFVQFTNRTGPTVLDLTTLWTGSTITLGSGSISNFTYLHSFTGSDYADVFTAGATLTNGFTAFLRGGNDTLVAGSGNDTVVFGSGVQTATGGAGSDLFVIGPGTGIVTDFTLGVDRIGVPVGVINLGRLHDFSFSQNGADAVISYTTGGVQSSLVLQNTQIGDVTDGHFLLGSIYNQDLTGTAFADLLYGSFYNDTILGGEGDDRIYNGGGTDKLYGEGGNDTFVIDGQIASGSVIDGGSGTDTLLVRSILQNETYVSYDGLTSIERLAFDTLAGNVITLNLSYGAITQGLSEVVGGAGLDALAVQVTAGGTYSLSGLTLTNWDFSPQSDTLILFAPPTLTSAVTLNARSDVGNQSLIGAQGNDALNGSGFNDFLNGGTGADTMTGGAGDDTFVVDSLLDVVIENTGEGTDTVQVSAGTATDASTVYALAANVENMVMTNGAGGQAVAGNALSNLITGSGGNDLIVLGDTVSPYTSTNMGNDTINAGGGNDFLFFNRTFDANDVVDGGTGYDTVGILGPNYTNLVLGANSLTNVEQFSMYSSGDAANPNSYKLTTNDANVASGQQLLVTAMSLLANETLNFNGSAETNGRFLIFGGRGADTIVGGAGNDRIIAGAGADVLTGGAGIDVFQFNAKTDSTPAARDTITDFVTGDKIDLWFLDANDNVAGSQHFAFIGSAAFSGAGQLRATQQSPGSWLVEGDTNGDGLADFSLAVTVADSHALAAGDFLL